VVVRLDHEDRLTDLRFSKITCSRTVGEGEVYRAFCRGRKAEEILKLGFDQVASSLRVEDREERFLLYLEWDGVRTALAQYRGADIGLDYERYRVASVVWDAQGVEIAQDIFPPKEMPKILPCSIAG
jgi:hypothetical protein